MPIRIDQRLTAAKLLPKIERLFDLSGLSIVGQKLINLGPPRMYGIRVQLNF